MRSLIIVRLTYHLTYILGLNVFFLLKYFIFDITIDLLLKLLASLLPNIKKNVKLNMLCVSCTVHTVSLHIAVFKTITDFLNLTYAWDM